MKPTSLNELFNFINCYENKFRVKSHDDVIIDQYDSNSYTRTKGVLIDEGQIMPEYINNTIENNNEVTH